MKNLYIKLVQISKNELVCLGSLIVATCYGFYYMDIMDPLKYSLSEIGRFNTALFILWAVLSGVATFLNVHRMYDRLGYKSKLGRGLLYSGLFFLVLTFCNMSREPLWYWIHVSTAILFAVLSFASITLGLMHMFKKDKKYRILSLILFVLIFIDIIFIIIYKQMALYEFVPLILSFVVLFFVNYTETFKVQNPEKVQK